MDPSANDGAVNGQTVTAGNLTFYEDGIQQEINGQFLIPIDPSGATAIQYTFDPSKTYTITVEEKAVAPYYKTRDIVLTQTQVNDAITSGLALNETVEWVEWSKPIKVSLKDSTGAPVAQQGVDITLADNDRFTYAFYSPEPRKTNVSGTATFPSHSYDPSDPDMCNILHDQVLITGQYVPASGNPTTVARIVKLANNPNSNKNEVDLLWPSLTVSGRVLNADGTPAANTRVAAYYNLPALDQPVADDQCLWGFYDPYDPTNYIKARTLSFLAEPLVYYTTTDAQGNYTLALPAGRRADICAGDTVGPATDNGVFTGRYATAQEGGESAKQAYESVLPHFPWISAIDQMSQSNGPSPFQGIFCKEIAPLSVTLTNNDLTGQDLTLGAASNGYRLRATVTVNGQPCTPDMADMPLAFIPSRDVTPPSNLHAVGGGYTASLTDVRGATQAGIDMTGVTLAPGEYSIVFTAFSDQFILSYINVDPVVKTISPADISDGDVDLGVLNFTAASRPVGGVNAVSPGEILSHFTPIPAPQPYGYLSTRIEATPDPAYGPFAYQFTVHYCGHHTGANSTQMAGGQIEVLIPAGVQVVDPGPMTSSSGKLTKSLGTIPTGEVSSLTFVADITNAVSSAGDGDNVTFELYSAPNYGGINSPGADSALRFNSSVSLKRPRITLNAPRTVEQAAKFRVFGNAAGTDGEGIYLYNTATDQAIATGALKGRFYYFNVGGQSAGAYTLAAQTRRFGADERSNTVNVEVVAGGAQKVEDAYIMRGGKKTGINANFGMVYYTAFVDADKLVPTFDLFFKLSQAPAPGEAVELDIGGVTFPAAPDPANPGYYKATVQQLYSVGEQAVLLKVGSGFTTQVACLMLMF